MQEIEKGFPFSLIYQKGDMRVNSSEKPTMQIKYAAGCLRRFSAEQKDNNSFETQRTKIEDLARKEGYVILDEYIFEDDGVSAYKKNASQRKGLMQLRKLVLEKPIEAVIFYDYSRMDRKAYSFVLEFYEVVKEAKPYLKFYNAEQGKEWTANDLEVKIHFLLARVESDVKSRYATTAHCTSLKPEKRQRPGSRRPYGYDFLDKQLIPNEEAAVVLFIFHLASWGYSMKAIATILNDSSIPSPKGKVWRTATIEHILKNKAYAGHLVWDIKSYDKSSYFYENNHEPIVPKYLLAIIESANQLKERYGKLDTPFYLSDLLHCRVCREILTHRNASTKQYRYLKYQCKHCKYEFDANVLHESIIEKIQLDTSKSFIHMEKPIKQELNNIASSLKKELKKLKEKEQVLKFNEQKFSSLSDKTLMYSIKHAQKQLKSQFAIIEEEADRIATIIEPNGFISFMTRFQELSLFDLRQNELRMIFLQMIYKVDINQEGKYVIHYQNNPLQFLRF